MDNYLKLAENVNETVATRLVSKYGASGELGEDIILTTKEMRDIGDAIRYCGNGEQEKAKRVFDNNRQEAFDVFCEVVKRLT